MAQPAAQPQPHLRTERRYDLDWIRLIGMGGVFLFHVSQVFNNWGWHVKNDPVSPAVAGFSQLLNQWIMPLFFLVSGAAVFFAFGHRTAGAYLRERLLRLVIPLVMGIFLLSPPQVFVERATQGGFTGTFLQFLPHYFDGWYGFGGNFAWMGLHLWYLLLLFLFSLITLPLFLWLRGRSAKAGGASSRFPAAGLVLTALPLVLWELTLSPEGLGIRDLGGWNPITYLTLFLYGYLFVPHESFRSAVRRWGAWLITGAAATAILLIGWTMSAGFPSFGTSPEFLLWGTLRAVNCWLWLLTLLALGDRYLNRTNPALRYWSEVLMPFYILHQPIIVLMAYFALGLHLPVAVKFPLLVVSAFAVILALAHFVVLRVRPLRLLFGVK